MFEYLIFHEKVDSSWKTISREAVRAVIRRGDRLLLVHSTANGDYKFPGGGVETGESPEEALGRELREECGAVLRHFGEQIARIEEFRPAKEGKCMTFKMISHYYACDVEDTVSCGQDLDDYEVKLGFEPVWIGVGRAIEENEAILASGATPPWTLRDTVFLRELLSKGGTFNDGTDARHEARKENV